MKNPPLSENRKCQLGGRANIQINGPVIVCACLLDQVYAIVNGEKSSRRSKRKNPKILPQ
ncbi:hypothetical protein BH09VER1_BH09VER1_28590 [soil metagenome]